MWQHFTCLGACGDSARSGCFSSGPTPALPHTQVARCVDDVFRPQLTRAVQRALRAAGAASAVSSVATAGLDPEERAARGGGGGGAGGGDSDGGAAPAKERNDKVGGPPERLV